ncbi:MAG: transglutaminase-like cysteine peptidase [Pseudomonadota bacterium]
MRPGLFGLVQQANDDITAFPQMSAATRRHQADKKMHQRCEGYRPGYCESDTWLSLLQQWQNYSGQELLVNLNAAINTYTYRADKSNYAREDYWATPRELIENGGDCEDFAIAKMLALQHLGVPAKVMRIVVVQNTVTARPHAVLAVSHGENTVILDNKTDAVFTDAELPHYVPLYSINERQWWLHMPFEVAERLFVQTASTNGSAEQMNGGIVSR